MDTSGYCVIDLSNSSYEDLYVAHEGNMEKYIARCDQMDALNGEIHDLTVIHNELRRKLGMCPKVSPDPSTHKPYQTHVRKFTDDQPDSIVSFLMPEQYLAKLRHDSLKKRYMNLIADSEILSCNYRILRNYHYATNHEHRDLQECATRIGLA
jgi:hypothetical protein